MVEGRTQGGGAVAADIVRLGNRRHQCRQCDIDRKVRDAECGKRLAGHRYRLDIGGRAFRTDQLAADLADLPLGSDLGAFDPQYLAGIAEPQRPRRVAEPGCGDPRDLRGHIGADADHAMRDRIHHAEGRGRHRRPGTGEQCLLKLDERRLDALVAVRRQCCHQSRHGVRLGFGLGRQQIVNAGRQQRRMGGVTHNPNSLSRRSRNQTGDFWTHYSLGCTGNFE